MCYIKIFIKNKKKKNQLDEQANIIKSVFKEPLEDIFEDPDYIKAFFKEFLIYSENYYNDLIIKKIIIDDNFLINYTQELANIDKNNKYMYNRGFFLLEYLSTKTNYNSQDL